MNANQSSLLAVLPAETRFLRRLADTLTEWADAMQAGNHGGLSDSTSTARISELFSALASSRIRLKQLAAMDAACRMDASFQEEIADFRSAWEELKMAALTAHALAQRGMLYTQTMITALSAQPAYGENGLATVSNGGGKLGEA